jgi:indole-3-pyruvate monooxygenase
MECEDILVVGAGPAGLATSACLRRQGLGHVVLERKGRIADAWHRHYDRLHLHTTKTYSGLPMMPWPSMPCDAEATASPWIRAPVQ